MIDFDTFLKIVLQCGHFVQKIVLTGFEKLPKEQ